MIGILLLVLYLVCGITIVRFLLPRHSPLIRIWIGLCLGFLLMMWLPALCAFLLTFSMLAHYVSLLPLALITGLSYVLRDKRSPKWMDDKDRAALKPLLALLVIFGVLGAYLQYTHTLRPDAQGNLHVGQSTYGDLPMHMSFITSFVNASFPPDYAMLKGELLCYPFLMDSLSTSLYMGSLSLRFAIILPGTLMMLLLYMGFFLMAHRFLSGGKAVVLAFLLLFLNGGLGFIYTFDLAGGNLLANVQEILTGFYLTPTNQPQPYNLRWSNLICDLLIPQRTLLAGYTMVLPLFYLVVVSRDRSKRTMVLLGVMAGALPMVHTHSFLALALCSLGIMVYDLCHLKQQTLWQRFKPYLIYGTVAACVAMPQLVKWTFAQTTSNAGFLTLHFNWSNNQAKGQGVNLIDSYLWFYLKNIGLPMVLMAMALLEKNARYKRVFSGAAVIFVTAELVQFQPNAYDNNKLLYLWYMLMTLLVADYARLLWQRLNAFRGRWLLAAVLAICLFLSSTLTVAREVVSDYVAFTKEEVAVAAFIETNTHKEDTFLTGRQHLNPVISLSGRQIPCGTDSWLYYHGYDTRERALDVQRFYENPSEHTEVLERYDIRYIYVSSYERSNYRVDYDALEAMFALVYDADGYQIFHVEEDMG